MNWIQGFHMGISKYHVRATHIIYTQLYSDCYILKYLLLNLSPKSPWSSGWLWTPKHNYMVFQSNTASRIQNEIVCDLFGTIYKFLTQNSSIYY